jgi:hypothetical protein
LPEGITQCRPDILRPAKRASDYVVIDRNQTWALSGEQLTGCNPASSVLLFQQPPKTIGWTAFLDQVRCLCVPQVHRGGNLPKERGRFISERTFKEIERYPARKVDAEQSQYGSRTSGCDLRLSVPGLRFGRTWGSRFVIMCL